MSLNDVRRGLSCSLLFRCLLLPAIMRVIDLATISILLCVFVAGRVVLALQVDFIRLHIGRHMMLLQVILVLHHEHVLIRHHVIGLIRNRVIQIVIVVIIAHIVLLR